MTAVTALCKKHSSYFPSFPEQIRFLVLKTLVIYKDKRKLFKGLGCYYYSPWLKLRISNVHCCYAWGDEYEREREIERTQKKKKRRGGNWRS
jgi:hypothetical protein